MFEAPGDLGLEDEPGPAAGVVGMAIEDLLEGELAVQLVVDRHEDGPQAALGVGPEAAEAPPVGGRPRREGGAPLARAGERGGRVGRLDGRVGSGRALVGVASGSGPPASSNVRRRVRSGSIASRLRPRSSPCRARCFADKPSRRASSPSSIAPRSARVSARLREPSRGRARNAATRVARSTRPARSASKPTCWEWVASSTDCMTILRPGPSLRAARAWPVVATGDDFVGRLGMDCKGRIDTLLGENGRGRDGLQGPEIPGSLVRDAEPVRSLLREVVAPKTTGQTVRSAPGRSR